MQINNLRNNGIAWDSVAPCICGKHTFSKQLKQKKTPHCSVCSFSLPADGRVQAFGGPVMEGNFVLWGGLPTMRSDGWTLETVGDWGMLGRVRDLASLGLCSFLSSDLFGNKKYIHLVKDCAGWLKDNDHIKSVFLFCSSHIYASTNRVENLPRSQLSVVRNEWAALLINS